jgi:hypothetical protein
MRYSEDTLMAFADGELDDAMRAEIEAAMAADPEIARTIERHLALAARIRARYEGIAGEPVPDRIAALVSAPESASVADLASRRRERAGPPRHRRTGHWAALAASVVVAVLVGTLLLREPFAPFHTVDGRRVARGELDRALTSELAALPAESDVDIGISFRDHEGRFCRTFYLQQESPVAGLACFDGEQWELPVLADAAPREDGLRAAGAMPLEVLRAVDAAIEGDPLDAAAEASARDAGWRRAPDVAE